MSALVVTGFANFVSSCGQQPTAGSGPAREHLTAGIAHPEKVKPSRGNRSASRSSGHSGRRFSTSVGQACGSRPFIFAVSNRLMICAARDPAASESAKSQFERPTTTGLMAHSQRLLSSGRVPSSRKQLSISRRFSIYPTALPNAELSGHPLFCCSSHNHSLSITGQE